LGKSEKTKAFLNVLLRQVKSPLVLDADALNIMAEEADMLALIPAKSVLTPHPKELQRLIGTWENDFEKLEKVKVFSQKYNCIVLVKGCILQLFYQIKKYTLIRQVIQGWQRVVVAMC
jgi:NAD(P)H-hydrate repair Nnr-like enzyme with NAD(P)H-hydrate dehydratase domain